MLFQESDDIEIRRQLVSAIIQNHGKRLVHNLIEASVYSLHSYMLGGVADVFMELLDNDRNVSILKEFFAVLKSQIFGIILLLKIFSVKSKNVRN